VRGMIEKKKKQEVVLAADFRTGDEQLKNIRQQ